MIFEFVLNKQGFTGDEITNELTDTTGEKFAKSAAYAWKQWSPGYPIWGTYYHEKISNAMDGATDALGRSYSTTNAILNAIGPKFQGYNTKLGKQYHMWDIQAQRRVLMQEIRSAYRQRSRNMISEKELKNVVNRNREKIQRLIEKAQTLK